MQCLNCTAEATKDGAFCSVACATERHALVLEILECLRRDAETLSVNLARMRFYLN